MLLATNNDDHIEESADFQAINSYLSNLESQNEAPLAVVPALSEALEMIKTVGNTFSNLNKKRDYVGQKFSPLLGNNPKTLVTIIKSLLSASKSCDQEATSFLLMMKIQHTFDGQFLNRYAEGLLNDCYLFNLSQLSSMLQRSVGKMGADLFNLIELLAERVAKIQRRNIWLGTIMIEEPHQLTKSELLGHIKALNFEGAAIDSLAKGLCQIITEIAPREEGEDIKSIRESKQVKMRRTYMEFIDAPCNEVISRMSPILETIQVSDLATSEAIKETRLYDPVLDYLLEIYRICEGLKQNEARIFRPTSN